MVKVNLGCGPLTVKYLMFFFNLIFFISGFVLIIVGGIAQGFFKEYIQFFSDEYKSPAIGIIILGGIILIVSFFGCCGSRKNNICMLRTFGVLLGMLVLGEFIGGITVAILRSHIESAMTSNMNETMYKYKNNDSLATDAWDDMQEKYHCCGTTNYTDWALVPWSNNTNVPDSCCKEVKKDCGKDVLTTTNPENIYADTGCSEALKSSALQNLGTIIGVAVGIALLQILGIWMSCCLVNAVKANYESI